MRRTVIFLLLRFCLDAGNDNREIVYFRNTQAFGLFACCFCLSLFLRKGYWKKQKHIVRPYSIFIFPLKLILHIRLKGLLQKMVLNYNDNIITPTSFNHYKVPFEILKEPECAGLRNMLFVLFSIKYLKVASLYTLINALFFNGLEDMSIKCLLFTFTQVLPFYWK